MKSVIQTATLILICTILICGCSGAGDSSNPVMPDENISQPGLTGEVEERETTNENGHYLLLYNLIYVDPDNPDGPIVEVVPVRAGEMHINILKFLEVGPCTDCFKIVGFNFPEPGILDVDIEITHPFDDLKFTVFDVRGIMMFNASHEFPASGLTMSDSNLGDGELLNAEGYTQLYNGSTLGAAGDFFTYFKGKLATEIVPDADLNGFIRHITDDPANTRNALYPEDSVTRTYSLGLPAGEFVLGYAVDASWDIPDVDPVIDPMVDFPNTANCIEPWKIEIAEEPVGDGLTDVGGETKLIIDVYDWQGKGSHAEPLVECPELFDGTLEAAFVSIGGGYSTYEITIGNDKLAAVGNYLCLVSVEDNANELSPEYIVMIAYQSRLLTVNEVVLVNPVAVATADPNPQLAGLPVHFSGVDSYDPDGGDIQLYEWDWNNDGSYDFTGSEAENTWPSVGTYYVQLKVTDDEGETDELDEPLEIVITTIEVTSPNGGEEWVSGTSEEITWTSENLTGTINLEYSMDNFNSDINMIATDEANDGSFMWETIPYDPSDTVRVRVSSTIYPVINDVSDADFTILQPSITVLTPNGGEEWVPWTWGEITWTSENVTGTVFIDYSKDNFVADFNEIASDELNDGAFSWGILFDPSDTVRVRVNSTDDPVINDVSDADFTILQPSITVLTPNGGEEWIYSSTEEITWTSQNLKGKVVIEYSKDNFVDNIQSIAPNENNDGSFMWIDIPEDLSDTVRVRVSSTVNSSVNDVSDGDFSIVEPGLAYTWGGTSFDKGNDVATDADGNVYITGEYRGTVDFDPEGGDPHTSSFNSTDVFLCKFDSSGNFNWARTWGFQSTDIGYGVAVDDTGDVYVTGQFSYTVDFDPDGGDEHSSDSNSDDVFLSKFDSSGNFQWARTWGGPEDDCGFAIDFGGFDNGLFVTGMYQDTVDFDPGEGSEPSTSNGDRDIFLSKFDTSGNLDWALTWGGTGRDTANDVTVNAWDVYVTGSFRDTVDFDPGIDTELFSSNGYDDVFLSSINSWGSLRWAKVWGGSYFEYGQGVTATSQGSIFVTGGFHDTVDFDPGFANQSKISNGGRDIFMSRFDKAGWYYWTQTWGGTDFDSSQGIDTDESGNIYVTGYYQDTIDFNPGTGTDEHTSNGDRDIFLSRFASNGVFDWARTWGGTESDYGYRVANDSLGNVYVTGLFFGSVDFAPTGPPCNDNSDVHVSSGDADVFLTKYKYDGCW